MPAATDATTSPAFPFPDATPTRFPKRSGATASTHPDRGPTLRMRA